MNRWFSADYHCFHYNICVFCGRPFDNAHAMTEKIIENHNAVVGKDDEFYHLGDLVMNCSKGKAIELLERLNGKKYFIRGNHDKVLNKPEVLSHVEWLKDYHELTIQDKNAKGGKQFIVMSHYPMLSWNRSYHGSIHIHGHVHSSLNQTNEGTNRLDVGIDNFKRPISYDEIMSMVGCSCDEFQKISW
jgi:calcineurin-like phosphoesterase family protein